MNCVRCGNPLSPERMEALPGAVTCVPCVKASGDVPTRMGYMVFDHKTAGNINIVSQKQLDNINRLDRRGYKRHVSFNPGKDEIVQDKNE